MGQEERKPEKGERGRQNATFAYSCPHAPRSGFHFPVSGLHAPCSMLHAI